MNSESVNISEIHKLVSPMVESVLGSEGFESTENLKWVRCQKEPIRQIFQLFRWKGGMVAPRISISLDFVPHVSGSSVKWHRTMKSAQPDLILDPHDSSIEFPYRKGITAILEKAPLVIPAAIEKANGFWATCSSEDQLLQAFEQLKQYYDKGLPEGRSRFRRYVPHELALSFVLARAGQTDKALSLFQTNAERFKYKPKVQLKLENLLMESVNA
jgi:hypothetical protein